MIGPLAACPQRGVDYGGSEPLIFATEGDGRLGRVKGLGRALEALGRLVLAVAAFGLATALVAGPAAAQNAPAIEDFGAFMVDPAQPEAIVLNGPILETALLDFRRATRAYPDARILVLNSPGGLLATALAIADEMFEEGFSTVIPSWARCFSACAFMFLAGAERVVVGELGVHQFNSDDPDLNAAQRMMADVFELLGRFDTPQEVITAMLRTPADDMHVFTTGDVERLALNRGFADGAEAFEFAEFAALALGAGDPANVAATLFFNPTEDDWDTRDGEATWWIDDSDGRVFLAGNVTIGNDFELAFALGAPLDPADQAGLILAIDLVSDDFLPAEEGTGGFGVVVDGIEEPTLTTLSRVGDIDDDGTHWLVSPRRWLMSDLELLREADILEIWLTDTDRELAVLQIEVTDLLGSIVEDWIVAAAEMPLGRDAEEREEAEPAAVFIADGEIAGDATVTWYRDEFELAARVEVREPRYVVDIALDTSTVFVVAHPRALFADQPVAGLSVAGQAVWDLLSPGIARTSLAPAEHDRLVLALARAETIELVLTRADGSEDRIVLNAGAIFDDLLDELVGVWSEPPPAAGPGVAAAPNPAPAPAAAAPNQNAIVPDPNLAPTYGQTALVSGFLPDPRSVTVLAGGGIAAIDAVGRHCRGFIAEAPDYRLTFTPGEYLLSISVVSEADTTLVVRGPDGRWHCVDDAGDSLNPAIELHPALEGRYDIWVGTYDLVREYPEATLYISEIGPGPNPEGEDTASGGPDAEQFLEIARFQDWAVYNRDGACYAGTLPVAVDPRNGGLEDAYLFLTIYPGEDQIFPLVTYEFDIDTAFYVTAWIDDGRPYDFTAHDRYGELLGRVQLADFAAEMRRGYRMNVLAVNRDGDEIVHTFSMLGVTAALNRARAECP